MNRERDEEVAEGAERTEMDEHEKFQEICRKGIDEWPGFHFKWNPYRRGNSIDVSDNSEELLYPCPSYCGCLDTKRLPGAWGYPALPTSHPSAWGLSITVKDLKESNQDMILCEVGVGGDYALYEQSYLSEAGEDRYIKSVLTLRLRDLEATPQDRKTFVRDIAFLYEPKESLLYILPLRGHEVFFLHRCKVVPDAEMWPLACVMPYCDRVKINISIRLMNRGIELPANASVQELPEIRAKQDNRITG